jgi:hypothetical protein
VSLLSLVDSPPTIFLTFSKDACCHDYERGIFLVGARWDILEQCHTWGMVTCDRALSLEMTYTKYKRCLKGCSAAA